MNRLLFAGIALVATLELVPAQERKADDRVKVELFLATEHVPKDLKAGTRVNLAMITGKTLGPKGLAVYRTSLIVGDVDVATVATMDKPPTPDVAMRVQLLVAKDMAEKVAKTRGHLVSVVERQPDGSVVRKMRPVPLLLELTTPAKK